MPKPKPKQERDRAWMQRFAPLFPERAVYQEENGSIGIVAKTNGITIREYFAGLAMQAYIGSDIDKIYSFEVIAHLAVDASDALISALNEDQSDEK